MKKKTDFSLIIASKNSNLFLLADYEEIQNPKTKYNARLTRRMRSAS